jgi:hypothetical protein
MSHLSLEALARLVDEPPIADESDHLDVCESCRGELEALREEVEALGTLPDLMPPPDSWAALETRLRQEGLIRSASVARSHLPAGFLRLAAALVLFLAGTGAGALLRSPAATGPVAALPAAEASGGVATAPYTAEDAAARVRAAEAAYLSAVASYAEFAGLTEMPDPLARLAALESIVLTTRAALHQAPADPIINGYHLTAMAQREAVLRQLAVSANASWF